MKKSSIVVLLGAALAFQLAATSATRAQPLLTFPVKEAVHYIIEAANKYGGGPLPKDLQTCEPFITAYLAHYPPLPAVILANFPRAQKCYLDAKKWKP